MGQPVVAHEPAGCQQADDGPDGYAAQNSLDRAGALTERHPASEQLEAGRIHTRLANPHGNARREERRQGQAGCPRGEQRKCGPREDREPQHALAAESASRTSRSRAAQDPRKKEERTRPFSVCDQPRLSFIATAATEMFTRSV